MRPQNILFLNPDPRRTAGCNVSLLGLIAGLDRNRFTPHMAAPANAEYRQELEQLGVRVVDYRANNWRYPQPYQLYRHMGTLRDRTVLLVRAIRELDIHLVYTNAEYAFEGGLAAKLAGVPHLWAQRIKFDAALDVLRHFPLTENALAQAMAELSNVVVSNSKARVRSFPPSFPREKLRVIESGLSVPPTLPPHREAKASLAALAAIPADSRIVLTVGRVSPEKDLATFLRTAASVFKCSNMTDVYFLHVGMVTVPDYRAELDKLALELGIADRVRFLGSVGIDHMTEIYRGADVFLLTSDDFEGFARACAEAMAAEVPVISTRCGGPVDYIEEGQTGFLCNVGDDQALTAHVAWVLDHPDESREMAIRGRTRVTEEYDERKLNMKWMTLFEEIMSQGNEQNLASTLQIELLINILTHIGSIGVQLHEMQHVPDQGLPLTRTMLSALRGLKPARPGN